MKTTRPMVLKNILYFVLCSIFIHSVMIHAFMLHIAQRCRRSTHQSCYHTTNGNRQWAAVYADRVDHSIMTELGFSQDLIDKGCTYFSNTPGFTKLMSAIDSTHRNKQYLFLKGYLYELEVSIGLYEQGHTITNFHYIIHHPHHNSSREIDICTLHYCIECKNIRWDSVMRNTKITQKLQRQFQDQHEIINAHFAHQNQKKIDHVVASRERIPTSWKTWFTKQAITYVESRPRAILADKYPVRVN